MDPAIWILAALVVLAFMPRIVFRFLAVRFEDPVFGKLDPDLRPHLVEKIGEELAGTNFLLGEGISEVRLTSVELPPEDDELWTLHVLADDGPYQYNVEVSLEGFSIVEVDYGYATDVTRNEADRRLREKYEIKT